MRLKFRQEAVKEALTQEQLSELIRITTTKDWLLLVVFLIFTFAMLVWGILGSIPTRVNGKGMLFATNGALYDAVSPEGTAHIVGIVVKLDDLVKKGDIVAHLANPNLSGQLQIANNYLEKLKAKYAALSQASQEEINKRQTAFSEKQTIIKQSLEINNTHLAELKDLLQRKKTMYKRGIINLDQVMATTNDYYAVQSKMDAMQKELVEDRIALNTFIENWKQKLRELDLKIADAEQALAKLKEEASLLTTVKASINGIVTNIHVAIGDTVTTGKPIVSIASEGEGLDAIVFVPAEEGQKIKAKAEALVSPTIIKKAEFGSLVGQVMEVSRFPSTPESMLALLHDQELVKEFRSDRSPIALRIRILPDAHTVSGYKWTSTTGPDRKIVPGMIVTAQITVRKQSPISLIIPFFRRAIYGE